MRPRKTKSISPSKSPKKSKYETTFDDLNVAALEHIASFLDTQSCFYLFRTCKSVHGKLDNSPTFWKNLCEKQDFNDILELLK